VYTELAMHGYAFRWIEWNVEHIATHGVTPEEAEYVVDHARPPWPQIGDEGKRLIWGPTAAGRLLRVVYVLDPDGAAFVIHAMELTGPDKRRYRRRRR